MPEAETFAPDIFSDPRVVFIESDNQTRSGLFTTLKKSFPACGEPRQLHKSGAREINSGNYRLTTSQGIFLVKKLNLSKEGVAIQERQQALLRWLHARGSLVPEPVEAVDGNYLCPLDNDDYLLAMKFVDGQFFAGNATGIGPLAKAIGTLQSGLLQAPERLIPARHYPGFDVADAECFAKVLSEPAGSLPIAEAELIERNRDLLTASWARASNRAATLFDQPSSLMHIDLHPHNMLVDGDDVRAVIDFDSVMYGPLNAMIGFSAFKLLRQVACHEQTDNYAEWVNAYLTGLYAYLPELEPHRTSVPDFATMELCRRIGVILRLNLLHKDTQWNHVLEIQLNGLKETNILFGQS